MRGPKRAVQRPELGGKGARKSQQTDEEFTRGAGLTSARLGCKRFSEADSYPGGQTNKAREPEAQGLRVGWGPEPPRLTARHRHQDGPGRPAPFPGPAGCDGKPPPPASAARGGSVRHRTPASPQNEQREASPSSEPFSVETARICSWVTRQTHRAGPGLLDPLAPETGLGSPGRPHARSPPSCQGTPPPAVRVALLATSPEH